jgi:hypothetical protein
VRTFSGIIAAIATIAIGGAGVTLVRAAGVPAAAAAQNDPTANPFVMRPGVVVDPAAGRLYMMNPQGGIDAVEIASGKLLWTTAAAAKPLAAYDHRLAAQAEQSRGSNGLPIALLDTRSGLVESTITVPAASGAMPSINDGMGSSSTLEASFGQQGLLIWWTLASREISGILSAEPPPEHKNSGAALIDLTTHRVTILTAAQAAAKINSVRPSAKAPRLTGTEALYFLPQQVDGFFVSLTLGPSDAGTPVTLRRWSANTRAPLPDVDLGHGYAAWAVSADNACFLITKIATGNVVGSTDYLWVIYALASGERLADIRLAQPATTFFVRNGLLVYSVTPRAFRRSGSWQRDPLQLRAVSLKSGDEIWRRTLRETGYRGPTIPRS